MPQYLTIDIGGTNIKFAVMDENAQISEQGEIPTPQTDFDEFVEAIGSIYDRYAGTIEAIAMSAPGRIDAAKGYFFTSGALKYIAPRDMTAVMKERCPVPFCMENDAKAAALAELWKGSMQGIDNGIVMTLGTGIGGAVIINGKLYRGTTFAAGEFSGISTRWQETYDSDVTWSESQSTKGLVNRYSASLEEPEEEMNGRIFFERVNAGDENALKVLEDYCTGLATGLYSLQLALDVQKVAIGGGISRQPLLIECVNRKMEEIFAEQPMTPASRPEIVSCQFGNDANLIGALYHYLYEFR